MRLKACILAFLCGGFIAAIRFFPLAWAGEFLWENSWPVLASQSPLSYKGTVWNGNLSGIAHVAPLSYQMAPINILSGQPPVSFQSHSPFLQFSGQVSGHIGRQYLSHFHVNGTADYLGLIDGRLQTLSGIFKLEIDEAEFKNDCQYAQGTVHTDILAQNSNRWFWQGPVLNGPVRCEDGALILELSGTDTQSDVAVRFVVNPHGTYQINADLASSDPRAAIVLPHYGFQTTDSGYTLSEVGKW